MVVLSKVTLLAAFGLTMPAFAHPGHEHEITDRAVKRSFLANSRRSLNDCAAKLEARGTLKSAALHRRGLLDGLRKNAPG